MSQVFGQFKINYKKTTNRIHPTALTSINGTLTSSIDSANIGQFQESGTPPDNYLYDEIFYDSDFELRNIKSAIKGIIVYAKIPSKSIRIPLVGGGTYSPDFAYVVKDNEGKTALNLIVESKGKTEIDLSDAERKKISHAAAFFAGIDHGVTIKFSKQLSGKSMQDVIKEALRA